MYFLLCLMFYVYVNCKYVFGGLFLVIWRVVLFLVTCSLLFVGTFYVCTVMW